MILCEIEISQSMNLLIIDKVQHLKAECSCFRLWLLGIRTYSWKLERNNPVMTQSI